MKKVLFMVLCMIMLMAVPMTVCAAKADPSPKATTEKKKKPKKPKKSPKTADKGMTEAAIILLAVSSGIIYISKREFDRA